MNREIKFRAWDRTAKVMLQVGDAYGTTHPLDPCVYRMQGQDVELMQYTSLRDTSGRDIYQDDVVEGKDGVRGLVLLRLGCWYISWGCELGYYQGKLYVIGNIYENPDLLEGEDE